MKIYFREKSEIEHTRKIAMLKKKWMTAVIIIRLINDFFRGVACFGYWYTKVALFCMSTGIMITVFKMKTGRSCLAHHYFFLTIYSACRSGWCSVVDLEKIFRDCNNFQCSPPKHWPLGSLHLGIINSTFIRYFRPYVVKFSLQLYFQIRSWNCCSRHMHDNGLIY